MSQRFRTACGARVVFEGDDRVLLFAPPQGIPQRPIIAGPWALAVLDALRTPMALEQVPGVVSGAPRDALPAFLQECLRHGILRPERAPLHGAVEDDAQAGFLVFALGASRYGRLALNAARTLRQAAPCARVALCHDGGAIEGLDRQALGVFERLVPCPAEVSHPGGRFEPLWAKLHADRLSPWRYSVVVDADSAFFDDAPVADELLRYREVDFAPTCSFTHLPDRAQPGDRVIVWADAGECFRRFSITRPLHQTHLFYFALRASAAATRLFETARAVYRELAARPLASMRRWYGDRVSAELAMSIATGLCEFDLYSPSHMPVMNNHVPFTPACTREYLGFTFCGVPPDRAWVERYDRVVAAATPRGAPAAGWLAASA